MRTSQQIVDQTNDLARSFYDRMGYVAPKGFKFYEAPRGREYNCWLMAREAQLALTETDPDDALSDLEPEVKESTVAMCKRIAIKAMEYKKTPLWN